MKINRFVFLLLFIGITTLIFLSTSKQASMADSFQDDIPMGKLGYPLGTYLTIEGVREEEGKVGTRTIFVDTVNSKKLEVPIWIWVENIKDPGLPKDERCILRGYESGKMIGLPSEVAKKENLPVPQAVWQFQRYFIVTSIVQPASLVEESKLE